MTNSIQAAFWTHKYKKFWYLLTQRDSLPSTTLVPGIEAQRDTTEQFAIKPTAGAWACGHLTMSPSPSPLYPKKAENTDLVINYFV